MKGTLVTLYLRGGHTINGSVLEFSDHALIKTLDGERVVIPDKDNIVAIKYKLKKNKETVKEEKVEDNSDIKHKTGDVDSLIHLRKLQHEETVKEIREKLSKPTPTSEGIEYGSTLSAMRAVKNDL